MSDFCPTGEPDNDNEKYLFDHKHDKSTNKAKYYLVNSYFYKLLIGLETIIKTKYLKYYHNSHVM